MTQDAETAAHLCINCAEPVEWTPGTGTGWSHIRGGVWCNPDYVPGNLHTQAEVPLIDGTVE